MQTFVKHLGYTSHKGGKSSKGMSRIKAHLKYIENRKDEQGQKPHREVFDKDGETTRKDFYKTLKTQPEKGVIAHKLCISMDRKDYEQQKIDLKELARDTMAAWEAKTGRQLNWVACIHDKHSNPHVHIVVAGRDLSGKEVTIMKRDLDRLKNVSDRQREQQAERNMERGIDQGREFEPFKQLEYERTLEPEASKGNYLDRSLEPEKTIEMYHER
jgi:type IV secretory pathway VirD2 relaxase